MQRTSLAVPLARMIAQRHYLSRSTPNTERLSDQILDQLSALRQVALQLKRNGYTLLGATIEGGLPTIEVRAGSLTDEMLALDLATHYKWTTVQGEPQRWGQFLDKPSGVRVIFVERPL